MLFLRDRIGRLHRNVNARLQPNVPAVFPLDGMRRVPQRHLVRLRMRFDHAPVGEAFCVCRRASLLFAGCLAAAAPRVETVVAIVAPKGAPVRAHVAASAVPC